MITDPQASSCVLCSIGRGTKFVKEKNRDWADLSVIWAESNTSGFFFPLKIL